MPELAGNSASPPGEPDLTARQKPSADAFLGGRVVAHQPAAGRHRSGLEAVLIGAAASSAFAGGAVDLGAGAGVAGMALAARCPDARVILAERDAEATRNARTSLALADNAGFADRVTIAEVDVAAPETQRVKAGLARSSADLVITNPPFYEAGAVRPSPGKARAAAHVLAVDGLEPWVRAAASVLKPGGGLVVIFRADGLDKLLTTLGDRFGGVAILPVYPRAGAEAHRLIVGARKGSRAPLRILPPLTLHPATGSSYLPEAERILRDGAGLADVNPAWALA
jgi:tRNA1(Val) A37 N6-methylase TrmN6